jgi:hypothetical protein
LAVRVGDGTLTPLPVARVSPRWSGLIVRVITCTGTDRGKATAASRCGISLGTSSTSRPHQHLPFQSPHRNTESEFLNAFPDPDSIGTNRSRPALTCLCCRAVPPSLLPRKHRPRLPQLRVRAVPELVALAARFVGARFVGVGRLPRHVGKLQIHIHPHAQPEHSEETHTSLRHGIQSGARSRQRATSQQPPSRKSSLPGQIGAGGRLHARTHARTHRDPSPSAAQRPQCQQSRGTEAAPRRTRTSAGPSHA